MEGIYKNRFLIGVYEKPRADGEEEPPAAILDNPRQFAAYTGMSVRCAIAFLSRLQHGRKPDLKNGGKLYQIFLIEYDE
jgi:hypothetical protein